MKINLGYVALRARRPTQDVTILQRALAHERPIPEGRKLQE